MTTWQEFRGWFNAEYINPRLITSKATAQAMNYSLCFFEQACAPGRLASINAKTFEMFIAKRREQKVSDGTVGRDLDHLRVAFRYAVKHGALSKAPEVPALEDERREVRLITPEHFKAIWDAAGSDWWQAFLATAVSTPFYVKELIRLRWDGVDLDTAVATLPAEPSPTNRRRRKPKRAAIHPLAIKYLRKLAKGSKAPEVFAWQKPPQRRNGHIVGAPEKNMLERWAEGDVYGLLKAFRDLQDRAGVTLTCDREHHHTDRCWQYGLDDLRVAAVHHRGGELLAALAPAK